MDCTVHGILQTRILEWAASPGDFPNPGIKSRSPALQADSLPSEPPGKPKNTGTGSLFLPADLPNPRIEPGSPAFQADSLPAELPGKPNKFNIFPVKNPKRVSQKTRKDS